MGSTPEGSFPAVAGLIIAFGDVMHVVMRALPPASLAPPVLGIAMLAVLAPIFSPACRCGERHPGVAPGKHREKPPAGADAGPEPAEVPAATGLLIVVIDAVRADALGCYGYERGISPNIDALAAESIVFERFYSSSPWTLPAFGTLLTGVSPPVHGLKLERDVGRGESGSRPAAGKPKKRRIRVINPALETLPEILGDVPSFAVVNNHFLHPKHGFDRGFDSYDQEPAGFAGYRRAEETTRAAMEKLRDLSGGPFFGLVHYFDPHVPYDPPEPFASRFGMGRKGRVDNRSYRQFMSIRRGGLQLRQAEKLYLRGLYDGEIAHADHWFGRLVDFLRDDGLLESTWLIVTAEIGRAHV